VASGSAQAIGRPLAYLIHAACVALDTLTVGRQQLFTENTRTPILPVILHRNRPILMRALRLWVLVLASNPAGALIIAWVLRPNGRFLSQVRMAFAESDENRCQLALARLLRAHPRVLANRIYGVVITVRRGVSGGDYCGADLAAGGGAFTHIIAGSVETLYLAAAEPVSRTWRRVTWLPRCSTTSWAE